MVKCRVNYSFPQSVHILRGTLVHPLSDLLKVNNSRHTEPEQHYILLASISSPTNAKQIQRLIEKYELEIPSAIFKKVLDSLVVVLLL